MHDLLSVPVIRGVLRINIGYRTVPIYDYSVVRRNTESSQEPQHRVSENGRAEELSNRATLEIMIDKIRQQHRLLPYTYL